MRILGPLAAALGVALAGCTGGSPSDDAERPTTSESPKESAPGGLYRTGGPTPPEWFSEREELSFCGLDAEFTTDYPNLEARDCFRDAYETGDPAELAVIGYGVEGESSLSFFRVLERGAYEAFAEYRPHPDPPPGSVSALYANVWSWVQYSCPWFVFWETGAPADGLPILNYEGECQEMRSVTRESSAEWERPVIT